MNEQDKHPDALNYVQASRISTDDSEKQSFEENVCVIREAPLTIDVEGVESYTLLCTPTDKQALAVGFLYSEGVIENLDEIKVLKECEDDPQTIRIRLTGKVPRIGDAGRNLLIVSSCGACGSERLNERLAALPKAGQTLKIKAERLHSIHRSLHRRQELFQACGGTHAAAMFDEKGKIISWSEDTGRHNALDKAIGKSLLAGTPTIGKGVALTSRLSLEMVSRCAMAGIEIISAVSAPTSMAIDVARNCNITLCAFVRETRATVFTNPSRIIGVSQ